MYSRRAISERLEERPGSVQKTLSPPTRGEKLFTMWALFYSTGAFWRVLQGHADLESGNWKGALVTNLLWIFVYLAAIFLLRRRCDVPRNLWKNSLPMLLPIPVAVLSLAWSDDPFLTFLRCGALIGTTLLGLYIALRYTIREVLVLTAGALGIAAISSLVCALWVPSFGLGTDEFQGIWIGAFAHKNTLGAMMRIGFLVSLLLAWYERTHKIRWLGLAALSIFLIIQADSMASLVICCALPYFLWVSNKTLARPGSASVRLSYFGLPALLFVAGVALKYEDIVEMLGRDTQLSGRSTLWVLVSRAILDKPYFGYGYEAFWRGYEGMAGEIWKQIGSFQFYSHNGFLEVLLGLGLIGLISVLIALIFFAKNALRLLQKSKTLDTFWPWAFFLYLVASNLTEANLMRSNTLPWLLYTITALSVALHVSRRTAVLQARPVPSRVAYAQA